MTVSKQYFKHKSSFVDAKAIVGRNTKIWHFSHIMDGAHIGENCNLGQNVFVASNVIIGDRVKIQNNVSLYEGVVIEDDVFCGPSCVFTNVRNPRGHVSRRKEYSGTRVGTGATIGANATIICGNSIGKYAFIGAGSCVTRDVASHALVYGVPASLRGWVCVCGEVLKFKQKKAACKRCRTAFKKTTDGIFKII